MPHHGSRHQDLGWLTSLGARVALVSVGADNDYGHPSPDVVTALTAAGARVWRTDLAGDVAVVVRDGEVGVVTRGLGCAAPWLAPPPPLRSSATSSS